MILNKPWDTPTNEIHNLTGVPKIVEFIDKLTTNYNTRQQIYSEEEDSTDDES